MDLEAVRREGHSIVKAFTDNIENMPEFKVARKSSLRRYEEESLRGTRHNSEPILYRVITDSSVINITVYRGQRVKRNITKLVKDIQYDQIEDCSKHEILA